ncbi:hypothetical protein DSL72_001055 [Monilinia vaccinii-corymbosi]|uniref:Uncharacterized protein n=1 Tax=Monilinia vaccinii-corymbosi TaxID=61207 RepID=A0A8A3P451_9HELO|nr:hypothetical protein DSL72_001055 [Monilinia vaccinii-corymbosi]
MPRGKEGFDIGGNGAGNDQNYCQKESDAIDQRHPTTSERGANIIGPGRGYFLVMILGYLNQIDIPIPKPITKTTILTNATSLETSNSFCTPTISAVMIDGGGASTKQVAAKTMVMYHLQVLDQFLGFCASLGRKVTSFYLIFPLPR